MIRQPTRESWHRREQVPRRPGHVKDCREQEHSREPRSKKYFCFPAGNEIDDDFTYRTGTRAKEKYEHQLFRQSVLRCPRKPHGRSCYEKCYRERGLTAAHE